MFRKLSTPAVILVLGMAAILTVQSFGVRMSAAPPTHMATVQLHKLIPLLNQDAADKVAIEQMQQTLRTQRDTRVAALEKQEEPARDMADTPEREAVLDEINLEKLNLQLWSQQSELEVIVEKALRFEKLHEAITKAIADLASAEGYDIVMVDDSNVEPGADPESKLPPSVQRAQQISLRRVLYTNPMTIDITSQVVARMNNSFKAGG